LSISEHLKFSEDAKIAGRQKPSNNEFIILKNTMYKWVRQAIKGRNRKKLAREL